jgi:integrase
VASLRRLRTKQTAERLEAGEAYERSTDLVFVNEIGDPYSPARISATFRRLVKAAGLPPLGLHGLRHTFATLGLDEDVDVLYLAEVLGHSSPAITQAIYQHTRPERKAEAVARIGAAIFG